MTDQWIGRGRFWAAHTADGIRHEGGGEGKQESSHAVAFFSEHVRVLACGALACILVPYILGGLLLAGFFTVPFGNTLQNAGIAAIILQSVILPSRGVFRLLNLQVVVWFGTLSYSLYIWQQLFCSNPAWFGWDNVWWMTWPGWLLATLLAACASFYLLERLLMGLRARFR